MKDHTLRLAFFDVDGTLKVERDPYMYLHRQLGTEQEGLAALNAYLAGEIDYETFAQRDAGLWAGVEVVRVDALFAAVPYVPEARVLAEKLRLAGVPIVLISSGVDRHVRQVAADLGAADWIANELLVADGRLTGAMCVRVQWNAKGQTVRDFMVAYGVGPDECLAVGDGIGDLPMFAEVSYRIAVRPSDEVVRQAVDLVLGVEPGFDKERLVFRQVGKSSPAHKRAISTHRGEVKPDGVLKIEDFLAL